MQRGWIYLAAAAVVGAAACGSDTTDTTSPAGPPVQTNQVSIGNNFFTAPSIEVPVGTTVTWTWEPGAVTHNVTFGDDASSGDKSAGATYSRTFATTGTFTYHCTIHPGMTGSVLVQ
jgi:plastocyanin